MNFENKVVIITGGAGGIGKASAELFAQEGAKLVLVDMNQEALDKVVDELQLNEERVLTVVSNVTKEEDVISYVNKTVERFGRIDVFFNNAGVVGDTGPLIEQTSQNFEFVLDVNVKGVFYGLKHVLQFMKTQQYGAIVNTASVDGLRGSSGISPYIASKHAVVGLTSAAAAEHAKDGIRVNAVCPAPVNTNLMHELGKILNPNDPDTFVKKAGEKVPMKRNANPEEIAQVVLFLASDKASYMTGLSVPVDGGQTSHL